jgi:hypothetical protein
MSRAERSNPNRVWVGVVKKKTSTRSSSTVVSYNCKIDTDTSSQVHFENKNVLVF